MAVSNESLNLLARYIGAAIPVPSQVNTARQILLRSQIDWSVPNSFPKKGGGGPSVVSRIFDILSRPNYAVANVGIPLLEDVAQHHWSDIVKDMPIGPKGLGRAWQGLSGQKKGTFINAFLNDPILQKANLGPRPLRAAEGLLFDVALDPTTYVGPGAVGKVGSAGFIGKTGKGLSEAAKIYEVVPPQAAENLPETSRILEAATRATGTLPEGKTAIPAIKGIGKGLPVGEIKYSPEALSGLAKAAPRIMSELPTDVKLVGKSGKALKPGQKYGAEFSNAMKYAQHLTRVGKSPSFYGQVQRAEQLLNRIRETDPQAVARLVPKAPVEALKATKAERSLAIMTARDTAKKLKISRDKFLNPKQQLVIYKNLLRKASGGPIERMVRTTAMMREAEKFLQSQGYGFKYWDGTGVKLTEIFDEMGSMKKIGPEILDQLERNTINFPPLDQAVEAIRARSAMKDSKFVELGLSQVTDTLARIQANATPARAEEIAKGLSTDLKHGMQGARVSPAAQKTASALFKEINDARTTPVQQAMSSTVRVAHDIMNAKATKEAKLSREEKINRAIERHMQSPYRSVATSLGKTNKAVEFMGERFATHYGQSVLRPIAQDYLLGAQANAARRSQVWGNVIKNTTLEARREALRAAQMGLRPGMMATGDPRVANLFKDSIERLFSSTGIKDTAASIATRAAFTMEDINKQLRKVGSDFQFTKAKKENLLGEIQDYSKGVDWLKSWETHELAKGKDPVEFIHQLEVATEQVSKRYALLDEVAARFSMPKKMGPFKVLVEDPRLAGRYFTPEAAAQVNRMNETLKNAYSPTNDFIKLVDKATSAWKSGVTIYAPSHHIRNLNGDMWLSWIAGVNSPKPYYTAAKVLKANKGRYLGTIPDVERLVGADALQQVLGKAPTGMTTAESVVVKTKSGIPLTAEQVYIAAHQHGLLLSAKAIEDIYGEPLLPRVFGGNVQRFARGTAETREHYVRLAHFIDTISKSKGSNLKEIFDNAAHTVRKWHPDGMDLTDFERKYLRRIFPFYSWTRKAFPLVLEAVVMRPGKVVLPAKINEAIQGAVGIDASRTDPFPSDQMFPDWIKEKGIGPIAATGGPLGTLAGLSRQGPEGGYTVLNPSNPMEDLISQFGGSGNPRAPLQGAGSMLNPLARIPIEVATNKQMFTDVPVSYDPNRYATEQIPGGAILSRLTNMGILGPTKRGQKEGLGNTEAIINYLTAAGLTGTGPYIQQAQYAQSTRDRANRKKTLQDYLKAAQVGSGYSASS